MAKKWNDVVNNPEYQKLSSEQKEAARNEYFEFVVKPNIPDEDLDKARAEFDDFSTTSTGESIANVYKEGLTGLKDLGMSAVRSTAKAGQFGLDRANDLLQGAIAVPEAAVGLIDIPTGGRVGKALEEVGYQPEQAKQFLTEQFSDEQKAANQAVSDADGFVDKTIAAIQNPRSIASAITQSAPLMGAGGVVGRGAVALGVNPVIAGAVGEGVLGAGSAAEGTRQQTDDGLLTGKQSGLALASGFGTALTSVIGGKLAEKLGIADIDTAIAGGVTDEVKQSLAKRLLLGGISEGVFEEMPQSIQEQVLSNIALDKPLTEGVDEAAAMGLLSGGVMGGGAAAILGGKEPINKDAPVTPEGGNQSGQRLIIDQAGTIADDALAAEKQAEYDAQLVAEKSAKLQKLPDQNLQNLRKTAETINPADVPVIDAEIERRANLGTLTRAAEIAQQVDPLAAPVLETAIPANNEAIDAADLLEADNVSNLPNDAATSVAAEATQATGDNVAGSVGNLPNQLNTGNDTGRIDNATEALTQSSGSDQPAINGTQGNNAVAVLNGEDAAARPFAQATDDFLPQMRSMTTDAKIINQIDEEIALRGIAPVKASEPAAVTTAVPAATQTEPVKYKTAKEVAEAFKAQTGDNIEVAGTKLAGVAMRNGMRDAGGLNGDKEPALYTPEQTAMIDQYRNFGKKSSNLFHITKSENLESIKAKGLITNAPRRYEGVSGEGKISLAANEETARVYGAPEDTMLRVKKDYTFNDLESDLLSGGDGAYTTSKNIPPEALEVKQGSKWVPLLQAKQPAAPKAKKPAKSKTLLATLRDLGGVAITEKQDVTGETKGFAPGGYNQIFKTNTKRSLKGLIESGDLDDYLPYNMRLAANGANDEAFDSTEAYDYLADKIRNGEGVLPYEVTEQLQALAYEGNAIDDVENAYTEDEINEQLTAATNEERESATNARVFDTERKDSSVVSSTGTETTEKTNTSQQTQVTNNQDLLGDDTAAKQALANAERAKDAKRNSGADNQDAFTLTGSNSEADQAAAAGAQSLFDAPAPKAETTPTQPYPSKGLHFNTGARAFNNGDNRILPSYYTDKSGNNAKDWYRGYDQASIDAPIESETKPADTQKAKDDTRFANNKIFTADKVAAARARLKSKLNTLNSGIDPELMMDGITIAGAYLETGVRKFSDYAKAMTEDFGDSIKPYLLSFYEAARAYPGIDKDGMTDQEAAAAEHQALLTPAVLEQAKEVIGQGLVSTPKAKAKPNGQLKLTQDWGVDYIDGWTDNKDGTGTNERENGVTNGVKEQFLAEVKKYLTQVSKLLEAEGWEAHKDRRGRIEKPVSVNESGIATSGEVTLVMRKGNVGVYVDIGTSAIRGVTGNHPQSVSIMMRATATADKDKYGTGFGKDNTGNMWLSTDLSSTELANKLMQTAERYVKNTEQAEEGNQNARVNQTEQVQPRGTQSDLLTEQPRDSDSESLDARMGRSSEGADAGRNVQSGISETSGNRTPSTSGSNRDDAPSGSRETSNAGNTASTADDVNDFEITDETGVGEGSLTQKYNDNITAIKLIKTLEAEKRAATPEERNQLAKYNGFGALSKVFEKNNPKYQELKDLLTEEEYNSAKASILNAYFTSPAIVKSMYDAVSHLGFKGGRVLEPSLGSGNFFGMMPAGMRNKSQLNGVELDVITSRLAKYLYPNANIAVATGFQKYEAPQGYFDLVISNPPFGSEQLQDSQKADYSGFSIHNFFIAKSIDKLRDDGVMAVVVSHSFMDAMDSKARKWISKRANLIGAVRLPNTAFKDNAGTEVITDIIFFRKTNKPVSNPAWIEADDNGDYSFNSYFYANPRNVLGKITDTTNQFGKTFTVEPLTGNGTLAQQLKEFIASLPANIYVEPTERIEVLDSADSTVPDGVKVGTFYVDAQGVVRQRMTDILGAKRSMAWEAPNAKAQERMVEMMNLRDLLRNQMRLERDTIATAKEIEANRTKLNKAYDKFLKEYGYLNSMTNRRIFMDDTESALLQAIELDYDQGVTKAKALATGMEEKPASAQKADILARRVLFPPSDSITVNNAKDALLASLDVKGVVDAAYMAEVYNKPEQEIISELGDVIYDDPNKGLVTADEYLSGDVKTKLVEAEFKAKTDNKFNRNVEALKKVIPVDKLPSEIYASAGANWIPADVYAEFANEITGIPKENVEFKYISAAATWLSEKSRNGDAGKMTSDYGTGDINSFDLFALLINGKAPQVTETIGSGSDRRSVVNIEKTEAARSKLEKIKETWNSWIFNNPDRADRLASIYNEKHNRTVKREFDGSHMNFAGMNPAVTFRTHQKNVAWRAIQDRNVLLDHVVGAGKTMAMASIAMEMKRLGIARKPLFVVPNHLTLQWRSEFTKLYPASNILAATPEDFAKDKREKMFSKMVTGDYDAIIIGHSSLTKVGLPAEVEEKMYQEQVKELSDAIEAAKTERGDRGITRDMEKIKQNLETKIDKLKAKAGVKDNVVSFDELGIDAMFIDEMHEFKNLFFTTQMQRTAGLGNPAGSGKALDMFMKIKFMTERFGENVPLITATGTPVSNSLAEMFTMQRYMKYQEMKRQDLHLFDAWAKQYGEVENVYEVAPSGVGYRQSTRFSKFKNLPSLMASYTKFADIVTMQDLKDQSIQAGKIFPVPQIKSGKPINVIAQRSDLQRDFFGVPQLAIKEETGEIDFQLDADTAEITQNAEGKFLLKHSKGQSTHETKEEAELELVTRALTPQTFIDPKSLLGQFANLAQLTKESKGKINALSLTGLANKAGLDYRIIDPSAADFAGSKINQAVTNMVTLWKDTKKDKGAQIVFCDLSIPNSARSEMGSKERRIYVRDRDGAVTHKGKGVVYAPEGYEGFPFYITKGRSGFEVYEAVSGTVVRDYNLTDKAAAKAWVTQFIESESNRDRIFMMRDTKTIDQAEIDEYREAHELEVAEDGSNEVSLLDLEAMAGSSKFSVYDDIRTKLISQGVPEVEIAFIHDFNSPKQKEELFKRVKRGDVRFLFGSTPKLGAGTNVQDRLVGLHHIDAPWRPSDLEQREGRIIRQGNKLAYNPDGTPIEGFEVAIYRYATEQTYDTRRWQLLEHKAAGIEQLRKYTGEAEIEDVASEASNSADMKAAASGNPLILEETKLRTEVKRLVNLEKAHADAKFSMGRRIKQNEMYATQFYPNRIAEYESLISKANASPVPADKTKIAAINIDGQKLNNREAAENAIGLLATKVRQSFTQGEVKTINYRGIDFTIERGFMLGTIKLSSPDGTMHQYTEKESFSPSGLITRFNNYIDSFEGRIEQAKALIESAKKENEQLKPRLNEPFESAELLKKTQAEHARVQRKLMKSSQLEAVPEAQRAEFERTVKTRKEQLKSLGFEKAIKESEIDNDAPAFSRNNLALAGLPKATIQKAVNLLKSNWKNAPEIIVVQDMNDPAIRDAVRAENERQLSQGATGQPEAFFDNGKVYVVASEMNSANDVVRVVFHEALGHYGLRGLYGKELGSILDQIALLRKRDMTAKAKEYGLDLTKIKDKRIAAEEVLAQMAQTAPSAGFVKRAIAAIRKFLRDIGVSLALTDNDIVVNYLLPARGYVVNGEARTGVAGLVAAFNRNGAPSDAKLFQELTANDEMFKYGKSDAIDLQQVFDEVVPELVKVERTNIKDDDIQDFYNIYPIDNDGNVKRDQPGQIMVYKDGKVELNVLRWNEGFGGSGVYAAVGNWAYNNKLVFAGDREGITPVGKLRRLENMISLALKFGTTDHIMPHPEQMEELEFDWREGDFEYNLGQMLEASYNAIRNGVYVTENNSGIENTYKSSDAIGVAKLDDLVYDFDKQQFIELSNGANPTRFTDKDFESLARTPEARAVVAGRSTLKRAAIAHTFVRAQGTERKRLLELVGRLALQRLDGTQLKGTFYSRSNQTYTPQLNSNKLDYNPSLARGEFLPPTKEEILLREMIVKSSLVESNEWQKAMQASLIRAEGQLPADIKALLDEIPSSKNNILRQLVNAGNVAGGAFDEETAPEWAAYRKARNNTSKLEKKVRALFNQRIGAPEYEGMLQDRGQTESENFKNWFKNSKVISESGKPLIAFHGTGADITRFNTLQGVSKVNMSVNWTGQLGSWFAAPSDWNDYETGNAEATADVFADDTGAIYPVYLSIQNPMEYEGYEDLQDDVGIENPIKLKERLKKEGYDGIVVRGSDTDGGQLRDDWVAFEPTQIKSAIGNNGNFDPENSDIRFSRSNPQSSLTPSWKAPDASKFDDVVYALQDKNIDLKRVSQAIKQAGSQIADRWNAYLQEELYHGRTAKRTQEFIKADLDPLIQDMRMRGVKMADFEEYLWARHAEERNIQIAKVNPKMPDGGSGMTTKDAQDYLANLPAAERTKYEALAKRVDRINKKSRQVLIDYGLEDASTISAWEGAYQYYVPLMREDMETGFGNGTGQGFSIKGSATKRATGSNRAVVDIIANIAQQYEKNIIRGEKNRVATALIGLAKLNPNDDFWQVDTPPTTTNVVKGGKAFEVYSNGTLTKTFASKSLAELYMLRNGVTGFTMQEVQKPDTVEQITDPNYKSRPNVVVARIVNKLGKIEERSVVFNQFDERAMRMAASIKNLDQDQINYLLAISSGFTRYFASINTQYNPIFGVINITRDVQGALLNLSATPIAGKKKEVFANTPKALRGIYQDVRAQRKSGQAANTPWAQLFEEFQREGGQTGYRNMYANAKDRSEALRDALDPTWWKESKIGKIISVNGVIAAPEQWMYDKAIKPIFNWLEDYNNSLENAVRLSVYKVALDNGQSKQQAASIAKNISVNFNRKGSYGRQVGSLYAFFNASVQGTARIGETMLNRDNATGKLTFSKAGKVIMQGGLLLGAMQALILAAAGYDEDEPPQFVRDRNIIIPLDMFGADGKYVTIPMPLGYNAIPATGRMLTEWALSGGKDTPKRIIKMMNMILDVTNPIGNAGISLQTITPTIIDPFSALAENKDFTGRPISRDDFSSLNPTPGFTRSRDKAWDFSVSIAQGINWMTGGTDAKPGAISPTADQIEYLAGQFTGGVGREVMKTGTTVDALTSGEDLPTYKIPLVGRFYGDTTGQSSQGGAFYNNIRKLNEHQAEIKSIREKDGSVDEYFKENPEAKLFRRGDLVYKQVQNLRKRQRNLKEKGESPESIAAIDDRITKIMTVFNEAVTKAEDK